MQIKKDVTHLTKMCIKMINLTGVLCLNWHLSKIDWALKRLVHNNLQGVFASMKKENRNAVIANVHNTCKRYKLLSKFNGEKTKA